jgi:hypothetical protein
MINENEINLISPIIIGFGCALVDLIVSKYSLNLNTDFLNKNELQIEMSSELDEQYKLNNLIDKLKLINDRNDISSKESTIFLRKVIKNNIKSLQLGGCTTNTLRLFNYLINNICENNHKILFDKKTESSALFICSIGDDDISNTYKSKLIKDSVYLLNKIL